MSGAPTAVLVVLRVLGVMTVVAVVLSAAWSVASSFASARASSTWTETGAQVLELRVEAADVQLVRTSGPLRVDVDRRGTWSLPEADLERDGERVVLRTRCGPGVVGSCHVDVAAEVPAGVEVVVRASAGDVRAEGLDGDLEVRLSAGLVRLEELRSQRVRVATGAGAVSAHFAEPPRDVDVSSSVGQVEVLVPDDGTAYRVDARASVGDHRVDVPQRASSDRTLRVVSSVGQVTVGRTDAGDGPPGTGGQ